MVPPICFFVTTTMCVPLLGVACNSMEGPSKKKYPLLIAVVLLLMLLLEKSILEEEPLLFDEAVVELQVQSL